MNYTLNMHRTEVCDLMMACTALIIELENEMKHDETCPQYRREHVLPESIKKWKRLHDMLKEQLDTQDIENGIL